MLTFFNGYNVSASFFASNLITQYISTHKLECLTACGRTAGCSITTLNTQTLQCSLFYNDFGCDGAWPTSAPLVLYSKTALVQH
jgi:hypothetical protein